MKDHWAFDKNKYIDKSGEEWLFVCHSFIDDIIPYHERPVEIYFRNVSMSLYGCFRVNHSKDNPYKYEKLIEKVVNDPGFREGFLLLTPKIFG